jgi:hypothetical protein
MSHPKLNNYALVLGWYMENKLDSKKCDKMTAVAFPIHGRYGSQFFVVSFVLWSHSIRERNNANNLVEFWVKAKWVSPFMEDDKMNLSSGASQSQIHWDCMLGTDSIHKFCDWFAPQSKYLNNCIRNIKCPQRM